MALMDSPYSMIACAMLTKVSWLKGYGGEDMMRTEQCTDKLHLKTHVCHHHVHRESLKYLIQAVHSWLLDDARVELAKR